MKLFLNGKQVKSMSSTDSLKGIKFDSVTITNRDLDYLLVKARSFDTFINNIDIHMVREGYKNRNERPLTPAQFDKVHNVKIEGTFEHSEKPLTTVLCDKDINVKIEGGYEPSDYALRISEGYKLNEQDHIHDDGSVYSFTTIDDINNEIDKLTIRGVNKLTIDELPRYDPSSISAEDNLSKGNGKGNHGLTISKDDEPKKNYIYMSDVRDNVTTKGMNSFRYGKLGTDVKVTMISGIVPTTPFEGSPIIRMRSTTTHDGWMNNATGEIYLTDSQSDFKPATSTIIKVSKR